MADIMELHNDKTAFHDDMVSKDRLRQLVGKFPSFPCIAERHPERVEQFIAEYNAVLAEVKKAVS